MLQNSITHHVSFKVGLYGGTAYVVWALPSSICHQDSSPSLLAMALKVLMVQTWKSAVKHLNEHAPCRGLQGLSHLASGLGIQPFSLCFALLRELYSCTLLAWDDNVSPQLCLLGELYWFGLSALELNDIFFTKSSWEEAKIHSWATWSAAAQSVPSFTEWISKCAAVGRI